MSGHKEWSTGTMAREHGVQWDAIFCDGDLVALVNLPEALPVLAAAHDLLDAAERLVEHFADPLPEHLVEEFRAAIAKARGGK